LESQYGDEDNVKNLDIDYAVNNLRRFKKLVKKSPITKWQMRECKKLRIFTSGIMIERTSRAVWAIPKRGRSNSSYIFLPRKFSISSGRSPSRDSSSQQNNVLKIQNFPLENTNRHNMEKLSELCVTKDIIPLNVLGIIYISTKNIFDIQW